MLKSILIAGTSLRAAEFALGAMLWGTSVPEDQALRLYDAYRAAGGNVLDTAHLYAAWIANGLGASERTLGRVLQMRGDRRRVIILSKGGHPALGKEYPRPDGYLAPEVIRRDIRESLERVGIDTIDLYFLHRDDRRVPVSEIIDLLNEEVRAGRVRYLGASNWRTARIAEANRYAAGRDWMGFVAAQPQFSLAVPNAPEAPDDLATRFLSADDLAWHTQNRFPGFCYTPTANGYFASHGALGAAAYDNAISRARLACAERIAAAKSTPARPVTPNQIALAWLRALPFPAIPILGTGDIEHLHDGLGAAGMVLTADEVQQLSAAGGAPR